MSNSENKQKGTFFDGITMQFVIKVSAIGTIQIMYLAAMNNQE